LRDAPFVVKRGPALASTEIYGLHNPRTSNRTRDDQRP